MAVEGDRQLCRLLRDSADNLGRVPQRKARVAGVHPFRRVGQLEVAAADQAARLQQRLQHLLRRAGVGRALQNDQHPRMQVLDNHARRLVDTGEVRLLGFGVRRGDADHHHVGLVQDGRVARRTKAPGIHQVGDVRVADVIDVGGAFEEAGDLAGIDVKAVDRKTGAGKGQGQWKADITNADDGYPRLGAVDLLGQGENPVM